MILKANGQEAQVSKCIAWQARPATELPICGEVVPAGQLFCPTDWALVEHGVRQAIIQEQRRLRHVRAKQPSHALQELLKIAVVQNVEARAAKDPAFKQRWDDFEAATKAAHSAAAAGLIVPGGERFGLPGEKP